MVRFRIFQKNNHKNLQKYTIERLFKALKESKKLREKEIICSYLSGEAKKLLTSKELKWKEVEKIINKMIETMKKAECLCFAVKLQLLLDIYKP